MEISDSPQVGATQASIYVYVPEVDAAYQRALQAGDSSIAEPEDEPYSERSAGVKDSFGNIWWISTFKHSVD
jgi:PhnB protein